MIEEDVGMIEEAVGMIEEALGMIGLHYRGCRHDRPTLLSLGWLMRSVS
jgi:hypothetical protein